MLGILRQLAVRLDRGHDSVLSTSTSGFHGGVLVDGGRAVCVEGDGGVGPLFCGLAQVLGLDLAGVVGHDELDLIVRGPRMLRALGGGLTSDNFSLLCGDEMPDCPSTIAPLTPLLVLLSSI